MGRIRRQRHRASLRKLGKHVTGVVVSASVSTENGRVGSLQGGEPQLSRTREVIVSYTGSA